MGGCLFAKLFMCVWVCVLARVGVCHIVKLFMHVCMLVFFVQPFMCVCALACVWVFVFLCSHLYACMCVFLFMCVCVSPVALNLKTSRCSSQTFYSHHIQGFMITSKKKLRDRIFESAHVSAFYFIHCTPPLLTSRNI